MPMSLFLERFRELGVRETKSIRSVGQPGLADGEYAFLEHYCNEPGCDCRRVVVNVVRMDTGLDKVWASIGYGWEAPEFYKQWMGADLDPSEVNGPYLDPLNDQSEYSDALLDLFRFLIGSRDYVERLERHYRMFRASIDLEHQRVRGAEISRVENKKKRLRDPRRRRRG